MKILLLYCGVALLVDLLGAYLYFQGINNLWLFHIMTILEYGFFIAIFSSWLKNALLKKILRISIPLFVIFGVTAMFFFESLKQFNTHSWLLASLIFVGASAYILFELSMEGVASVFRQPRFWVSSAALIYFSSTLVVFSLSNILLNLPLQYVRIVFVFSILMNIVANIGYAGGFLCQVQAQKFGGH